MDAPGPSLRKSKSAHQRHFALGGGNTKWQIGPAATNIDFARGLSPYPEYAKLAPFMGGHLHAPTDLNSFLRGRLISFNRLCGGSLQTATVATAALIAETQRLGWPHLWIAKALVSLPRQHDSQFVRRVRQLGKHMRKSRDTMEHTDLVQWLGGTAVVRRICSCL